MGKRHEGACWVQVTPPHFDLGGGYMDVFVHFVKLEQDVHLRCTQFTLCSYTLI